LTFYICNKVQCNFPGRTTHSLPGFETRTPHYYQLLFTLSQNLGVRQVPLSAKGEWDKKRQR